MYTPIPLDAQTFVLSPQTQAGVARAEMKLIRMEEKARNGGVDVALSHALGRLEAISTIRIEGKLPSLQSLLCMESSLGDADVEDEMFDDFVEFGVESEEQKNTALEVIRYTKALNHIYERVDETVAITPETLLNIHSYALYGRSAEQSKTHFREKRYVLPSDMAASKVYEPPSPESIRPLIEDLCAFINEEAYAPTAQAAIAHFQFEEIKPFKSGLDKTGRLMCHAIYRHRGLLRDVVAPIGLEPAIDTKSHAESLLPYNFGRAVGADNRMVLVDNWTAFCAWSAEVAVHAADVYLNAILSLKKHWIELFGAVSRGSAVDRILSLLPGTPMLTVKQAASFTGKSITSVNDAFARLEKAGILEVVDLPRRSRVFRAPDALKVFEELDRRIVPAAPVDRDSLALWLSE